MGFHNPKNCNVLKCMWHTALLNTVADKRQTLILVKDALRQLFSRTISVHSFNKNFFSNCSKSLGYMREHKNERSLPGGAYIRVILINSCFHFLSLFSLFIRWRWISHSSSSVLNVAAVPSKQAGMRAVQLLRVCSAGQKRRVLRGS